MRERRDGFSRTRSFFLRAREGRGRRRALVDGLVNGQPVKRLMIPARSTGVEAAVLAAPTRDVVPLAKIESHDGVDQPQKL